jgi:hypothetical protein
MKNFKTNISHRPPASQKGEWIGIEIECYIPYRRLKVKKSKVCYDSYGDKNGGDYNYSDGKRALGKLLNKYEIPNATIKDDGSIESPDESKYFEVEVCLLLNRKDYGPLQRLCKLLKSLGTQVNDSCGLHVHLDCRDLGDVKRVRNELYGVTEYKGPGKEGLLKRGQRLGKVLPLMRSIVDESRIGNEYCQEDVSYFGQGKYYAVNLNAFLEHKTIEVRFHESSIDFKEIHGWTEFLYFVSRSKIESEEIFDFEDFKKEMPEAPKQVLSYLKKKAA